MAATTNTNPFNLIDISSERVKYLYGFHIFEVTVRSRVGRGKVRFEVVRDGRRNELREPRLLSKRCPEMVSDAMRSFVAGWNKVAKEW